MSKTSKQSKNSIGIIIAFFLVPFISSVLSTIHIISFADLGNHEFVAYVIAATYEIGSITAFIVVMNSNILKQINRGSMVFIFIMLFIVQALGNLYSVFSYVNDRLAANPQYLDTFKDMFFNMVDTYTSQMIIGFFVGVLLPLISLIFLKSATDYFYGKDAFSFKKDDDGVSEVENERESVKKEAGNDEGYELSESGKSHSKSKSTPRTHKEGAGDEKNEDVFELEESDSKHEGELEQIENDDAGKNKEKRVKDKSKIKFNVIDESGITNTKEINDDRSNVDIPFKSKKSKRR